MPDAVIASLYGPLDDLTRAVQQQLPILRAMQQDASLLPHAASFLARVGEALVIAHRQERLLSEMRRRLAWVDEPPT